MCYLDKNALTKKKEMTLPQIKDVIANMPFVRRISLVGGEIFVRNDIFDILEFMEKKGVKTTIATNGVLINKEKAARIDQLKNIEGINVSLDGTKEIHNAIRGLPFAFQKTIESISLLQKNNPVNIVVVLQKRNMQDLPNLVKELKAINAKVLTLEYERLYSRNEINASAEALGYSSKDFGLSISGTAKRDYSLELLTDTIMRCEEEGKKAGVYISFAPTFLKEELNYCYERNLRRNGNYTCKNFFEARIDPYGNVFHCYALRKRMGNVLEKPFREIWNSAEYRKFRRNLTKANLLPVCETCLHMRKIN